MATASSAAGMPYGRTPGPGKRCFQEGAQEGFERYRLTATVMLKRLDESLRLPRLIMFTIEQIDDLHTRLGSAKTLPEYVRALNALGVERYDSYLADGHSEYFGQGGQTVVSPPAHEVLAVAETSQRDTFLEHLRRHEQRQTTYLEMSMGLAQSGIEKWTVDTDRMTMTFYDKAGREMLVERIR